MHFYIASIFIYLVLTFAALWIIDLKNQQGSAKNKM